MKMPVIKVIVDSENGIPKKDNTSEKKENAKKALPLQKTSDVILKNGNGF